MLFKKGGNRYKLSFIKVDREIAKAESQIAKLKLYFSLILAK